MTGSLYIFWFLHQTTTQSPSDWNHRSCISFDSYIKPQLRICFHSLRVCCISFDSYIKPQLFWEEFNKLLVVYLLIPTSNHNSEVVIIIIVRVVYLLIPTSNHNAWCRSTRRGWVVYLLIPTSNHNKSLSSLEQETVVYLLIPTSNHNAQPSLLLSSLLYIFWFLHQPTTYRFECTDFQYITTTLSNKKWWVGYNF